MEKLEFLVVQDAYEDVETNQYATSILPAAVWAEKEGCFTNTERRVNYVTARWSIRPATPSPTSGSSTSWPSASTTAARCNFPKRRPKVLRRDARALQGPACCDISGMSTTRIKAADAASSGRARRGPRPARRGSIRKAVLPRRRQGEAASRCPSTTTTSGPASSTRSGSTPGAWWSISTPAPDRQDRQPQQVLADALHGDQSRRRRRDGRRRT